MFDARSCGGWFAGVTKKPRSSGNNVGWGATLDIGVFGCFPQGEAGTGPCNLRRTDSSEEFAHQDVIISDRGLRFVGHSGTWTRVLARARGASSRIADDCLSTASTNDDDDDPFTRTLSDRFTRTMSVSSSSPADTALQSTRNWPDSTRFSDLRKIGKIGEGVTATVWRFEDAKRSPFAVKQIPVGDKRGTLVVVEELVTCYGLDHPAVTTCYDVFFSNDAFHLVMELMEGGCLLQAMKRQKVDSSFNMPLPALACIADDILSALQFLHDEMTVVHRDVKPGNILLSSCGKAKLGDLGIATALSGPNNNTKEWVGTVTYMSPERLCGDEYSFSCDIWALGLVLVEAATGHYPLHDPVLQSPRCASKKRKHFDFWDLLEASSRTCPALVLSSPKHLKWAPLVPLATACLAKNPAQRPRAAALKSPDAACNGVRALAGASAGARGFLAAADSHALARWVRQGLEMSGEALPSAEAQEVGEVEQGLSEVAGTEAEGWL